MVCRRDNFSVYILFSDLKYKQKITKRLNHQFNINCDTTTSIHIIPCRKIPQPRIMYHLINIYKIKEKNKIMVKRENPLAKNNLPSVILLLIHDHLLSHVLYLIVKQMVEKLPFDQKQNIKGLCSFFNCRGKIIDSRFPYCIVFWSIHLI